METNIRQFLPYAIVRLLDWRRRFRNFGLDSGSALRAAFSGPARAALEQSRAELLPADKRRRLGVVADIGGNQGQWAASLARFIPIDRLVAFEPNPHAMAVYRKTVEPLVGQLDMRQYAVGREAGQSMLKVPRASNLASLLPMNNSTKADYNVSGEGFEEVAVEVVPLDKALAHLDPIDLVKLDVQGFERSVLAGGRDVLSRSQALLVEMNLVPHYEGEADHVELWRLIEELGFRYWNISEPMRGPGKRGYWFDVLFIREETGPGEA